MLSKVNDLQSQTNQGVLTKQIIDICGLSLSSKKDEIIQQVYFYLSNRMNEEADSRTKNSLINNCNKPKEEYFGSLMEVEVISRFRYYNQNESMLKNITLRARNGSELEIEKYMDLFNLSIKKSLFPFQITKNERILFDIIAALTYHPKAIILNHCLDEHISMELKNILILLIENCDIITIVNCY